MEFFHLTRAFNNVYKQIGLNERFQVLAAVRQQYWSCFLGGSPLQKLAELRTFRISFCIHLQGATRR